MKKETTVVIESHPYSRQYNRYGGAVDIKEHSWIHINVKFLASPSQYQKLFEAFSTTTPFEHLGWVDVEGCTTKTISRWTVRESPVAREEGDSLWLAFECLKEIPNEFFQYLSNKFQIKIRISYCPPYRTGKWAVAIYEPI